MNKKPSQAETQFNSFALSLGFDKSNIEQLRQALTHSTFFEGSHHGSHPKDNQRLEFLGDAVLDLVIGAALFQRYPEAQEGDLSKMRAFLVCEASLAEEAKKISLQQYLRMGKGAEAGGDRSRASVQADAYEAMLGAIFLNLGFAQAEQFLLQQFSAKLDNLTPDDYEDKKSLLQELVQARTTHGVSYKVLAQSGPDHAPQFKSAVYAGKIKLAEGAGGSKKESEIAAAAVALKNQQQWLDKLV